LKLRSRSTANPYLAFSANADGGIDGIKTSHLAMQQTKICMTYQLEEASGHSSVAGTLEEALSV